MARRTALAVILKILAGLLVLLGLAALAIFIRLSSGPIEVAMFRDDVARNISNARGGRGVEVGEVTLEWLRSERRVVFVASDLILLDDAGVPAAKAGRAELLVNSAGILSGELQPIGLALSDGRVEIRRTDTGWVVAGDPVGTINTLRDEASVEPPPTMRALVDRANDALVDIFAILRDNAAAASLETIRFEDVEIEISDEVRGTTALLSGAVGELVRSNDGLSAIVSGQSDFGEDGPGQFTASASLPSDYSSLSASFALDDWSVASVADWIPGPPIEAEDIPANLALDFVLTEEAGLTGITTEIEIGSGTITLAGRSVPITGLTINGQYDLAPDRLVLDVPQLDLGPISTSARLEMETLL
ncbi:MAG: hypothetical protein AAFV54_15230, partial [Pseudomonadota bacterium]